MKVLSKIMKNTIKALFASFALFSLASCEVGLGRAVDLTPPNIKIESHKDNDSVASTFTVYGIAYDNEGVSKISIDFVDAEIYYSIVPGEYWKKKYHRNPSDSFLTEEIITESPNNYCNKVGNYWKWSIAVDTQEKVISKQGNNFTFEATAEDNAGNSGKDSKTECTLIVDTKDPSVSIYKPELYTGAYSTVESTTNSFDIKDNNVISRLLNGDIVINGRQSDALSFKQLRVVFDSGELNSGSTDTRKTTTAEVVNSIDDIDSLVSSKFNEEQPTVYFSKTLNSEDLREWSLTVKPEDWITNDSPLKTGKHIIRVVTTSLSSSNAWERKVIGYFIWYPEADIPWITAAAGSDTEKIDNAYECYPDSDFSGNAYDDDALKSITTKLYKRVKGENDTYTYELKDTKVHEIPSGSPKYAAWSTKVPKDSGFYKIDIEVEDYTCGTPVILSKYFKTSDVSAPKIEIISPVDNSCAIANVAGDLNFNVKATDNSNVAKFAMVWLNPALRKNPSNKIKFLTGEAAEWNQATSNGFVDTNGNKIYKLESNKAECILNKTFNLYNDFGVDGDTKTLVTQEFVFLAIDDTGSKTVKALTLTGDIYTPEIGFDSISFAGVAAQSFNGGALPAFPNSCNLKEATIKGTWSDLFTDDLVNTTKVKQIEISWGDNKKSAKVNTNGTWTVKIGAPNSGGTITARLTDFAGNTKTVQSAASIETSELSLNRIDCQNDDGAYKVGSEINITLEFTKNTDVLNGTPTLTLNNGGTASYVSGSGTSSHVYLYKVLESNRDVEKLSVSSINANNATWRDSKATDSTITLSTAPAGKNLDDTRSIAIDKTAPRVKSIVNLSGDGYNKKDSPILLMMEFNEDVTITNSTNLEVNFNHNSAKAGSPSETGSRYVLFTYTVEEGHNANPLTFKSITGENTTVKDSAGNALTNWTPVETPSFASVIIDTAKPNPPTFKDNWNPSTVIFEETSFELVASETEYDSIEYTIDGTNWTPYTGKVSILNNGSYTVKTRQTDKAGNVSDPSTPKVFTIDKGDLLTRFTTDTTNGTYSTKTTTKAVKGRIIFRKDVEIEKGAEVVLNVKRRGNYVTCPLNECVSTAGSSKEFTFDYTIVEGDTVDSADKIFNVTGLVKSTGTAINSVKFVDHSVNVDFAFPASGNGKLLKENREIYIVTGKPAVESVTMENGILNIKFDRNVNKGSGNLVLTYSDYKADGTTAQKFYVPAVLTVDEYNELKSNATVAASYDAGTNGASKNGNYLVNDTTTKYILKSTVEADNADLVAAFKTAKKHMITVPLIADAASITGNLRAAAKGDTLSIDLSSTYALPVKGAVYNIAIPAGAVSDDVKNTNDADSTQKITAEGVESVEIRIVKPVYKITIPATSTTNLARTKNATVNINDMETATMYLSCRTPGATIKYNTSVVESTKKLINSNPIIKCESAQSAGTSGAEDIPDLRYADGEFTTKTTDATIPAVSKTYTAAVTLKGSNDVSSYANAGGLKIAIAAQANVGTTKSDLSYEYATRTVVKFMISNYRDANGNDTVEGSRNNTVYMRNLRMWLTGGDGTSGENSNENTPFSWTDTSKFMLMAGTKTNPNSTGNYDSMYGNWWWVTWDITDTTYIGFVAGNVPSDGATMGPDKWYCADYHWTTIKEQYPLYPGETLVMMAHGSQDEYVNAKFFWDSTEKLWYYSPYYAKFGFETKKAYTRPQN